MLKVIIMAVSVVATVMAIVFICACVVGSRYEKGRENSEQYNR